MSDTIYRQEAIDAMADAIWHYPNELYANMNDLISRQTLCEYALNQKDKSVTPNDIMRFPSAIIHCKDCKHYKFADNRAFGFPVKRCKVTGFEDVDNDDFCSRAERRTDV